MVLDCGTKSVAIYICGLWQMLGKCFETVNARIMNGGRLFVHLHNIAILLGGHRGWLAEN